MAFGKQEISAGILEERTNSAIQNLIKKQEQAGLPIITEGEYRRINWQVSYNLPYETQ